MRRLAAALLACFVLLSAASATGEGQPRVVVLRPDDELARAISLSLSPWGVETTRSDAAPPQASQPEAVEEASRLARELGVEAVVWISEAERGSVLWVFDARAKVITTRVLLETPPFGGAAAAAVALSVKTVLRSSIVAPPAERFGASPASGAPATPPPDQILALELGAGAGWVAQRRAGLTLDLAAVAWLTPGRSLGVSLAGASLPRLAVEDARFRGSYRELSVSAGGRWRLIHERHVSAHLSAGGALRWVTLDGTLVESTLDRKVGRWNASLDAGAALNLHLGSASYLGTSLGLGYFPMYRRYLVEGVPIFSPSALQLELGGHFGVALF